MAFNSSPNASQWFANPENIISFTISASVNDFNLETHIEDNLGYDGSSKVTINVTINSGVVIGSTSHTTPSFQSGTIGFATSGSKLNITNNGTIQGAGGRGGRTTAGNNGQSTNADGRTNKQGGHGGTALKTTMTTVIDNTNGSLIGGGGVGCACDIDASGAGGSGGGGGAGVVGGPGGGGVGSGQTGGTGTSTAGGIGRTGGIDSGAGGGPGQAGENGDAGGFYGSGGSGGDAGKYLDGNSNTTFTANGTRTGAVA